MKQLLPGALFMAAATAVSAAPMPECATQRNDSGTESPESGHRCPFSASPKAAGWLPASLAAATDVVAYAIQLTSAGDSVESGLYSFLLNDFPAAQRVGATVPDIHALAFNPAGNKLYAVRNDPNAGSLSGIIDLETGTFNLLNLGIAVGFGQQVTGLTFDPRDGQVWLSTNRNLTNNPPLSESYLWNVDPESGAAQFRVRMLPDEPDAVIIDLAMNCRGELYAHNISDDSLYRINTGDGSLQRVGSHGLPANFAQGMDFDRRDDTLYAWIYTGGGNNSFGTLDTSTAAFTALAENAPRGEWVGAIPGQCAPITIQDPAAFDGAWYPRYAGGQGFSLRYFESANTWFMPWFTFAPEPEEVDEDTPLADFQRWYTLQGEVQPGVEEVVLTIVETTGGAFDDPAPVQRVRAGEARLRFLSCREGVLDYAFDEGFNDGLNGTIGLTRLTRRGKECADANNVQTPAERSFDAAITGSWFDPASSGQGMDIIYSAGDSDEELAPYFFGTWFTFQPAPEDDEDEGGERLQQWFTLESPSINDDGVLSVGIGRRVGGWFDGSAAPLPFGVGSVELHSESCDRLRLKYRFNAGPAAGVFAELEDEILLHRIGACAD